MGQKKNKQNPAKREKKGEELAAASAVADKDLDVEQGQAALMQMRNRLNTLAEQVSKMSAKYTASQKQELEAAITKADLQKDDAPDAVCYVRRGRMFTQQPRADIIEQLNSEAVNAKAMTEKLKVALAQMQIKTKQENATFQQMMVDVQRAKAQEVSA